MRARGWLLAGCAGALGCASVLGIPSDALSFCAQPANQGHSYCEDFDVGDPSTRWSFSQNLGGALWTLQPSDASPPRLIDFSAPPSDGASTSFTGFDKEFPAAGFGTLKVGADMRIVTHGSATFDGLGGVLLISDKAAGCAAMAIVPIGIQLVNLTDPVACGELTAVASGAPGGQPADAAPMQGVSLGGLPLPDTWLHLTVEIAPATDPDAAPGSYAFALNFVGLPSGYMTQTLLAQTFSPAGPTLVGFAVSALARSGPMEVQFDNVTIDVTPAPTP